MLKNNAFKIMMLLVILFSSLLTSFAVPIEGVAFEDAVKIANNEIEELFSYDDYYIIDYLNRQTYYNYSVFAYESPFSEPGNKNNEPRYLGKTKPNSGENIPNYNYPYDKKSSTFFDDMNWIPDPFNNDIVTNDQRYSDIKKTKFDNYRSDYLPQFIKGMEIQHGAYFRNDPGIPWEKYMHIVIPPTRYAFGLARLWHINSDNSLWYIDVALAPEEMVAPQATVHISHYTGEGIPIDGFDYTDYLGIGETKTYDASNIYGLTQVGSKVSYNTVPAGSIDTDIVSVVVTANETVKDIYIEFFYKETVIPPPPDGSISKNEMDTEAQGFIKGDDRGVDEVLDSEEFDVSKGIPTSEDLYSFVRAKEYIYDSVFQSTSDVLEYSIEVEKTWHLTWKKKKSYPKEDGSTGHKWVSRSDTVVKKGTITIKRPYTYWFIERMGLFSLSRSTLTNGALPMGQSTMLPYGYTPPVAGMRSSKKIGEHLIEASYDPSTIKLSGSKNGGKSGKPTVPSIRNDGDAWNAAENRVGTIQVRNDEFQLNGEMIMDGEWVESSKAHNVLTETPTPLEMPDPPILSNDVLYAANLTIPDAILNGIHFSSGNITYELVPNTDSSSKSIKVNGTIPEVDIASYAISGVPVNDVQVHTPVVCNTEVEDLTAYNQRLYHDVDGYKTVGGPTGWSYAYREEADTLELILDQPFKLVIPDKGEHLVIRGYGDRNYLEYINRKQVIFPFGVYKGTDMSDKTKYIEPNTWTDVYNRNNSELNTESETFTFYLPPWVEEGKYTIGQRVFALNEHEGSDVNHVYKNQWEEHANLIDDHYIAVDTQDIEVVGRLYGLQLVDITDPSWYDVFWEPTKEHKDIGYYAGTKNRLGLDRTIDATYTLPVVMGSNPGAQNLAVKPGYEMIFTVNTIGSLYNNRDMVRIKPRFYYVDENGQNRTEVDLYYHDGDQQFIQIGGVQDNKRWLKFWLGNPANGINDVYLDRTASIIYNRDSITTMTKDAYKQLFRRQEAKIGKLHTVFSWENTRIFKGPVTGMTPNSAYTLPDTVDADIAERSKQGWAFKYYLPNDVYACDKGIDIIASSRIKNGGPGFLNAYNTWWKKDGYLIVNFEIVTIVGNDQDYPRLSYSTDVQMKASNVPLMSEWDLENYQNTKEVYDDEKDYQARLRLDPSALRKVNFEFWDGDIALFHMDKKASDDYAGYGTH